MASQSERDHFRYLRKQTNARVLRCCSGEMEREVHAVLGPVGVDEKLSRQVAQNLLKVEVDEHGHGHGFNGRSESSVNDAESNGLRWSKDVGISAFLLKFGEGLGK